MRGPARTAPCPSGDLAGGRKGGETSVRLPEMWGPACALRLLNILEGEGRFIFYFIFFNVKKGGDNIHGLPYFPSFSGKNSCFNMCENDLQPGLYTHIFSRRGEAARGGM